MKLSDKIIMQSNLQERQGNSLSKKETQMKNQEEITQRIQEFCLLDDDFMTKCFEENVEATELVLCIVLSKPDIKVEKVATQYNIKNIKGRSLRLDIFATDSTGKKYNIEIQRADKGADAKRARYHSSLIDCDILPSGFEVENLTDTYVIFITENDVIGKNKPIYHVERYISEAEEYFNDGSHIIYVNASYKDDTELGKLMHDFSCSNPDDMNYKVLAATARYFKEDKEGIRAMSRVMEKMITEVVTDTKKDSAVRMLEDGKLTIEQISKYLDLPEEFVEKLSEELQPV